MYHHLVVGMIFELSAQVIDVLADHYLRQHSLGGSGFLLPLFLFGLRGDVKVYRIFKGTVLFIFDHVLTLQCCCQLRALNGI
jgi:hypothetical protein